jgi:GDP-mannose 6-dehydrogenase
VDVSPAKIELVTSGRATVVEERIGDLTATAVQSGALRAISDVEEAIEPTEVSLICVGTPSAPNGSLSTSYLQRVAQQIGEALAVITCAIHQISLAATLRPIAQRIRVRQGNRQLGSPRVIARRPGSGYIRGASSWPSGPSG